MKGLFVGFASLALLVCAACQNGSEKSVLNVSSGVASPLWTPEVKNDSAPVLPQQIEPQQQVLESQEPELPAPVKDEAVQPASPQPAQEAPAPEQASEE